ncbi:hypothetical protein DFH11DRAFT_1619298 [Phellopilus nigrolimitatus]|nr:hypothetical protein DFH11DRAFT_1619298 [Phellopilus nigrolimitatus]
MRPFSLRSVATANGAQTRLCSLSSSLLSPKRTLSSTSVNWQDSPSEGERQRGIPLAFDLNGIKISNPSKDNLSLQRLSFSQRLAARRASQLDVEAERKGEISPAGKQQVYAKTAGAGENLDAKSKPSATTARLQVPNQRDAGDGGLSGQRGAGRPPYQNRQRPPQNVQRPPYQNNQRPPYQNDQRPPYQNNQRRPLQDGQRPPFQNGPRPPQVQNGERPPFQNGPRPPFQNGPRSPLQNGQRPPPLQNGQRLPFQNGSRPPFQNGPRQNGPRPPLQNGQRPPFQTGQMAPLQNGQSPLFQAGRWQGGARRPGGSSPNRRQNTSKKPRMRTGSARRNKGNVDPELDDYPGDSNRPPVRKYDEDGVLMLKGVHAQLNPPAPPKLPMLISAQRFARRLRTPSSAKLAAASAKSNLRVTPYNNRAAPQAAARLEHNKLGVVDNAHLALSRVRDLSVRNRRDALGIVQKLTSSRDLGKGDTIRV